MSRGHVCPGFGWAYHGTSDTPSTVLTRSGSHQNMYGWQANGTYPILSGLWKFLLN